jgi:hypothetical protein
MARCARGRCSFKRLETHFLFPRPYMLLCGVDLRLWVMPLSPTSATNTPFGRSVLFRTPPPQSSSNSSPTSFCSFDKASSSPEAWLIGLRYRSWALLCRVPLPVSPDHGPRYTPSESVSSRGNSLLSLFWSSRIWTRSAMESFDSARHNHD